MTTALVAAILAVGAAVGGRLGRAILVGLSAAERLAWSGAIGAALGAVLFLGFAGAGIAPSPVAMLCGTGGAAAAALVLVRGRREATDEEKPTPLALSLVVLAGAAAAIFAVLALSEPMWSNDFQAIWGLKAKTIALSGALPARLFHDPMTAWSHPEYPLLLPVLLAAVSATAGTWDDHALALVFPFFELVLLFVLYGAVKRRHGPTTGALAALLASAFFSLFHAFEVGMAEIPLAAFLVLFGAASLDFVESPSRAAGARVALSALLASATKQEGALFVLLSAGWIAASGFRGRRGAAAYLALAGLPPIVHEGLLVLGRGWIRDRDYDYSFLRPDRWGALALRAGAVAARVLREELLPNAIPIAALAGFLLVARAARGSRSLALLGPPLLAQAAVYAAVCVFSTFDPRWQAQFLPRLDGVLFPTLLLAAGPRLAFAGGEGKVPPA